MAETQNDDRYFEALVAFEKLFDPNPILSFELQGAVGWMGIRAKDEDDVYAALERELNGTGLKLIDVDQLQEVDLRMLEDHFDAHLAQNVRHQWEPGKQTVWGTIFTYYADGEA